MVAMLLLPHKKPPALFDSQPPVYDTYTPQQSVRAKGLSILLCLCKQLDCVLRILATCWPQCICNKRKTLDASIYNSMSVIFVNVFSCYRACFQAYTSFYIIAATQPFFFQHRPALSPCSPPCCCDARTLYRDVPARQLCGASYILTSM